MQPSGVAPAPAPVVRVCQGHLPRAWLEGEHPIAAYVGPPPDLDPALLTASLRNQPGATLPKLRDMIASGAEVLACLEHSSAHRDQHLARLQRFLDRPQVPRYVRDQAQQVLDELFTNAVYNAPVAENGARPFAQKARTEAVVSPRPVSLCFGLDAHHAAVAVRDFYGSMDVDRILRRLQACYERAGARAEDKAGGAGLGFFLVLQAASALVINIHRGHYTEVVCLHALLPRRRDFLQTSVRLCVSVR